MRFAKTFSPVSTPDYIITFVTDLLIGGDSDSETTPLSEVINKKKKLEQASPDSLASELNREDADAEDNGNMGDVEQVRTSGYLSHALHLP